MKRALLALGVGLVLAYLVRRAVKGWPVVLILALTSCASLPATNLPVCDQNRFVLCRAPVELHRSFQWEEQNACPKLAKAGDDAITICNCYLTDKKQDERQVYYWFACPKPKEEKVDDSGPLLGSSTEGTKG